jgi:hypothetical protein
MIRAIVRERVTKSCPAIHMDETYPPGLEMAMVRWGDGRDTWWTLFDIDYAHAFRNDEVEVLRLTHNQPELGQLEPQA